MKYLALEDIKGVNKFKEQLRKIANDVKSSLETFLKFLEE